MSPRTPYRSCSRSRPPEYLRTSSVVDDSPFGGDGSSSGGSGDRLRRPEPRRPPPEFVASVLYSERVSPEYAHHLENSYYGGAAAVSGRPPRAAPVGPAAAAAAVNAAFQPDGSVVWPSGLRGSGARWRHSPPESDESGSSRGGGDHHLLDLPVSGQSRDLTVPLAALNLGVERRARLPPRTYKL